MTKTSTRSRTRSTRSSRRPTRTTTKAKSTASGNLGTIIGGLLILVVAISAGLLLLSEMRWSIGLPNPDVIAENIAIKQLNNATSKLSMRYPSNWIVDQNTPKYIRLFRPEEDNPKSRDAIAIFAVRIDEKEPPLMLPRNVSCAPTEIVTVLGENTKWLRCQSDHTVVDSYTLTMGKRHVVVQALTLTPSDRVVVKNMIESLRLGK